MKPSKYPFIFVHENFNVYGQKKIVVLVKKNKQKQIINKDKRYRNNR